MGRTSVTTTCPEEEVLPPALVAVRVNVSVLPTCRVVMVAALVTVTSAQLGSIATVFEEPEFPPGPLGAVCMKLAELVTLEDVLTSVTIWSVALEPGARSEIVHVTVCAATPTQELTQLDGVEETKPNPFGSTSVTST